MLRKRQWLTAAVVAAALAAQPLAAERRARPPLLTAWEALTSWLAGRLGTIPAQKATREAPPEGSSSIDPNGATTATNPPLCAQGQAEDSCQIDPNG